VGVRQVRGHGEITAVLERRLAADPVRNTVVGSVLRSLAPDAWCAAGTGPSDGAVAARSDRVYPALLTDGWHPDDLPELARLVAALPELIGASGAIEAVVAVADGADRPVAQRLEQRLFRIDRLVEPRGVPGRAVLAGVAERDLLLRFGAAFEAEIGGSAFVTEAWVGRVMRGEDRALLWEDEGRFVSVAGRRPVAAGSARIGPVYTSPSCRGRGYAAAVTAAATRDILGEGAVPVLFTDLANPTSNGVYQRLGYYPVADYAAVTFETVAS
jgi:predicted GNAT family acetyltransferase